MWQGLKDRTKGVLFSPRSGIPQGIGGAVGRVSYKYVAVKIWIIWRDRNEHTRGTLGLPRIILSSEWNCGGRKVTCMKVVVSLRVRMERS